MRRGSTCAPCRSACAKWAICSSWRWRRACACLATESDSFARVRFCFLLALAACIGKPCAFTCANDSECPAGYYCLNEVACLPKDCLVCGGACVEPFQNCGACGHACDTGQVCNAGSCAAACGQGQTNCSGACATLSSDR